MPKSRGILTCNLNTRLQSYYKQRKETDKSNHPNGERNMAVDSSKQKALQHVAKPKHTTDQYIKQNETRQPWVAISE